jgi:hypothetical protein
MENGWLADEGIYYPKILSVQVQYPRRSADGACGEDVISILLLFG